MAPIVEGAGVELNVVERGSGAPVLLVHGLAADAETMAPVAEALASEARVIAYDRRGYGASGAPEPYRGTTVEEQAQDAAALLAALDPGAAVVCGDGFGALVALDLAKRHRALVRAVALRDAPLFMFVPEATEQLAAQHAELDARRASRRGSAGRCHRTHPRPSSAPAPPTPRSSPTTLVWRAGR
jgi:pimeloyl-ACP methyl ester carboxylesterase